MLFYATVDFYLFYDWAAGMQIWALLTISQCKDSDTQGTVKALGPFVWVKMGEELLWYYSKLQSNRFYRAIHLSHIFDKYSMYQY